MALDSAPALHDEKFCVHIWAVTCRVHVMRCGNCSGCKWWITTKLKFSHTVVNSKHINTFTMDLNPV